MSITFRGTTLPYAHHTDSGRERAKKIISFPAVDGTYEMNFGTRQRTWNIAGRIVNIAGTFKKSTIEAWDDDDTGTLNIHGNSYTYVKLVRYTFGNCYKDAVSGHIGCNYVLELKKLR